MSRTKLVAAPIRGSLIVPPANEVPSRRPIKSLTTLLAAARRLTLDERVGVLLFRRRVARVADRLAARQAPTVHTRLRVARQTVERALEELFASAGAGVVHARVVGGAARHQRRTAL